MLSGDKDPTKEAIEVVAPLLGVEPEYFREYRVERVRAWFLRFEALDRAFYKEMAAFAADLEARQAPGA
jgi:hypothetical protein